MKKEKRLKTKRIYIRVDDNIYETFGKYVKENDTTKTKIIENFLRELLKDDLKG